MVDYIIAENPDDRVLRKASQILKEGGLVAFPTDTNWLAVCDPFSKKGVEKLYSLKNESKLKHYSLICDSLSRASEIAVIYNSAFRLLKKKIPGHYTFIFEAKKKIIKAVKASKTDHEVGIRFIPTALGQKLIEIHDEVLMGTNWIIQFWGLKRGARFTAFRSKRSWGEKLI